jgi:choline-glycine betaine transporter
MSTATTKKPRSLLTRVDPAVLYISVTLSALFVAWGVFFTDNLASVAEATLGGITRNFGWLFVLSSSAGSAASGSARTVTVRSSAPPPGWR